MSFKDKSTLDKPGQFVLDRLEIISYRQDKEESKPKVLDITGITLNFEIAEDIFSNNMVGSIIIYDAQDIKAMFPLTGMEKLSFRYSTPGMDGYDCTEDTGQPMQIYKVDKVKLDPQTGKQQLYKIFFCSPEMYNNSITRVSRAFAGPVEDAVDIIFRSKIYLNSKKPIFFEPTKTNSKHLIPNIRPYAAINYLAKNAKSAKFKNAGYVFFENQKGFHFRSLESMSTSALKTRTPAWEFTTMIVPLSNPNIPSPKNVRRTMSAVNKYQFERPVDTMANIQTGMFANRLIVHDAFNKTLKTYDYNYKEDFKKSVHTEDGGSMLIPDALFGETNKALYEHPLSKIMAVSQTAKIHDDYDSEEASSLKGKIINNLATIRNMNLNLQVYGNTSICAGDVIKFKNQLISPAGQGQTPKENPYTSGNYLVLGVKHVVNIEAKISNTIIKCYKDSVSNAYPSESDPLIVGKEDLTKGDIYTADEEIQ